MGVANWADAMIHSTRVRPKRPPRTKIVSLIEPIRIETDGLRWLAVRVASSCEAKVAEALTGLGYRSYCPLGAKFKFWSKGARRGPQKYVAQFPVFSRYIFVGLRAGQVLSAAADRNIEAVLGNSVGPLYVPAIAIRMMNDLELAHHWDETRSWREKSPFQPGSEALITAGPFAGVRATVDRLESESKIAVLVSLFCRLTPLELSPCQIEPA